MHLLLYFSHGNDHFNFGIEAFNFLKVRKSIRIHCKIIVCKLNNTSPECVQACRQRRSIQHNRARRDVTDEVMEVDYVETKEIVYVEKERCKDTTCPADSTCLELFPAVCRCNLGFVKEKNTGHCRRERRFEVQDIHLEQPYLPTYDDTTSLDYLRFITKLEEDLMITLELGDTIEGVKIISVRRGSVIIDVSVLYAREVSKEDAFIVFSNAAMSHAEKYNVSQNDGLRIKPDTILLMKDDEDISESERVEREINVGIIIAISVASFLALIVIVIVVIFYLKRRQSSTKEVQTPKVAKWKEANGKDNLGIDSVEGKC